MFNALRFKGKGTYILLIKCLDDTEVKVGSLGTLTLYANKTYAYIGSAFGPGGLLSRVRRHLSKGKRRFWHIDYILNSENKCYVTHIIIIQGLKIEHKIAKDLMDRANGGLKNFGSTDCACYTHMFFFNKEYEKTLLIIEKLLQERKYEYSVLKPGVFTNNTC